MGRKSSGELGERHKRILGVLERFADQNGYPPSIREIGVRTNISSTSVVNYYLDQLEKMNYIERDRNVSRGVRLLKTATGELSNRVQEAAAAVQESIEQLLQIPLLGRIVASAPAPVPSSDFAYFDADSSVEVARSVLPSRDVKDLYALEVKGDSMIDAMVNDGDWVIMKPAREANNGEMVAIWLTDKDETTLKHFYREKNRIRLQPANPTMAPIYIDDPSTVQIQGKVVMVIRRVFTPQ